MNLPHIRNIIFDLGGVIIDLNTAATFQQFQKSNKNPANQNLFQEDVSLFLDYEKGLISSAEFREGIRALSLNTTLTDSEIDDAWNKMLLQIPLARLELVERLRKDHRLFVLSNTNEIHVSAFNQIVQKTSGKPSLDHFFEKIYYSHLIKLRKPEREIYEYVVSDGGLIPKETLFVDDREENILAAQELGLQTFHVTPDQDILAFFAEP
ncbi:MAG: HAD family phosphatase [Cyclobacteriaceae bacterium]